MTFWTGVASRPPQSFGQLIAAQRPSFSRRCQSLRRSWLRETLDDVPPALAAGQHDFQSSLTAPR